MNDIPYGFDLGYPFYDGGQGYDYVTGAPPPPSSGSSEIFAKLAILGLTVAGVATAYMLFTKMTKNEKKSLRQATRSAKKILSKAAERQSERAMNAASDRFGAFLEARRMTRGPMHVKTEVLNHT